MSAPCLAGCLAACPRLPHTHLSCSCPSSPCLAGPVKGTALASASATAGACLAFVVSRYLARPLVEARVAGETVEPARLLLLWAPLYYKAVLVLMQDTSLTPAVHVHNYLDSPLGESQYAQLKLS